MVNGDICPHHTDLAVKVGQHETRLTEGEGRMNRIERSVEKIENCVDAMQATLWKWAGAIAVLVSILVTLATIFGPYIAAKVLGPVPR